MKRYIRSNIQPTSGMTIGAFIDQVKQIYHEYFPDSECMARNLKTLGMEYIRIHWLITNSASECSSGIRENDMFHIAFTIDLADKTESGKMYDMWTYDNSKQNEGLMPSTITMEVNYNDYIIKPENKYCVYGRRRLPFRKTTGTPEKILDTLRRYAQKLHTQLEEDLQNDVIHPHHVDLVRTKL